eukprot:38111-Prymnesium_polylepis.1
MAHREWSRHLRMGYGEGQDRGQPVRGGYRQGQHTPERSHGSRDQVSQSRQDCGALEQGRNESPPQMLPAAARRRPHPQVGQPGDGEDTSR